MNVYWLEQREEDVPYSNDWLAQSEQDHLRTLRFLKRRIEWRLGRWTAKLAISSLQNLALDPDLLTTIEIHPAPSGAPQAFQQRLPSGLTISISHRSGVAMCALAAGSIRLGCDLETVEVHSASFITDYFTPEEQHLIECVASTQRWRLIAILWSAKESALKALQEGLRRDTRSVTVRPGNLNCGEWTSLQVQSIEGERFCGWWRETDGIVQTVVADDSFVPPIRLRTSDPIGYLNQRRTPTLAAG